MLQTSANPTRRINASSGFYYAVLPSFVGRPFILVRCPHLLSVWRVRRASTPVYLRLHVLCMYESHLLRVWDPKSSSQRGLNHLSSGGLSRAMSGLSYQSIDVAPAWGADAGGGSFAPPHRNTNVDADSFCFGHLSRHWSPCGLLCGWQMDCHLWMRGDWDTSPHISLSGGVQTLPPFCPAHPSVLCV